MGLGRMHAFRPVFITEVVNRPLPLREALKHNAYLRVLREVADRHSILLIDTFSPLATERTAWHFYDFIHPNQEGHRRIATAIYDQLFGRPP